MFNAYREKNFAKKISTLWITLADLGSKVTEVWEVIDTDLLLLFFLFSGIWTAREELVEILGLAVITDFNVISDAGFFGS